MLPVSSGGYQDDYSNKINDGESHNVYFLGDIKNSGIKKMAGICSSING